MEIFADLRCFQDPCYAFRGVGYHSSTLLRAGRNFFPQDTKWIGLVDPSQPAIPAEYSDLVDDISDQRAPHASADKQLFIQCSPMTHDASRFSKFLCAPSVVSAALVYDFIPLDMSERYLSNAKSATDYLRNFAWLARHDLMFPISQYSANRLLDLIDVARRDVHVTGVALRPEFEAILSNSQPETDWSAKQRGDYFLFVGGADRRKNLDVVLRAHAKLPSHNKPALVVVGSYPTSFLDEALYQYKSHGGNPRNVQPRSDLTDSELAALYRDCLCMICSSEIEGFSLPPVEAICCGSAVLASRNEAHLELVPFEDATFDPHDHERLQELMNRAIHDDAWIQQLINRESGVAQRFLRDRVAYRFWGPITKQLRCLRGSAIGSAVPRRKSLAILTPFPPDRSGVADYTQKAVEEIGKLVAVDIFCENPSPQPSPGVRHFHPLSDRPYTSGDYDQVLSVVGNSHFHTRIIEAQVTHGGPCLIHDNRLAELYNWWKGPEFFQNMASKSLGRNVSFAEAQEWVSDPGKLPSMFYDELIQKAKPLIVHSRGIQRHVKAQYGIDAQYLPFCVYRHFSDELLTADAKAAARRRLGIPSDTIAIISLGIVSSVKAPKQCIEALAGVRQRGINAHLYFVGSAAGQEDYVQELGVRFGVRDAVHLCGDWVDEQLYNDYVIAADMAIQLRTHFFGGLSGALLDCIASGLITVANDDLAEAMDAPNYVLRISDRLEPQEIARSIFAAVAERDFNARLNTQRSQYLEEHSFVTYAKQFVELLGLKTPQERLGSLHAA